MAPAPKDILKYISDLDHAFSVAIHCVLVLIGISI